MAATLKDELRRFLGKQFPNADWSECVLDFNRGLESRMKIGMLADEEVASDNFFVKVDSQNQIITDNTPSQVVGSDTRLHYRIHARARAPFVYLMVTFEVGDINNAFAAFKAEDADRLWGFVAIQDWLLTWGNVCCLCEGSPHEADGYQHVSLLALVDPLGLELIAPDQRGRATIAGTRFRVAELVEQWLDSSDTAEEIRHQLHERLTLQQVRSAFAYYHSHQEEIRAEIEASTALAMRHAQPRPILPMGTP